MTNDTTSYLVEELEGTILSIRYYNPENGYAVLEVRPKGGSFPLTLTGNTPPPVPHYAIQAKGSFSIHKKFGRQFSAQEIHISPPSSRSSLEKYLSSGEIPGIGKSLARKLLDKFGEDALEALAKRPEEVAKLPGIGKKRAFEISERVLEQTHSHETKQFLMAHGIPVSLCQQVLKRYSSDTRALLERDPYRLMYDIKGIGFRIADTFAQSAFQVKLNDPLRIRAAILHTVEDASLSGHVFVPMDETKDRTKELLRLEEIPEFAARVSDLISLGELIESEEKLYLPHLYYAETFIARFIADRLSSLSQEATPQIVVQDPLSRVETELGLTFSEEQKNAVLQAVSSPLFILTGGPGCGKTTVIRAILHILREQGKRVLLTAPTGKAAQRMASVCEVEARTIHRTLGVVNGEFAHGPSNPLMTDAIIVDEASMIDLTLAAALFSALTPRTILILVGDRDQLPSVGPGRLLGDLLSLQQVPSCQLSKLFRRDDDSRINPIAYAVKEGAVPEIPTPDGTTKSDAYFIESDDPIRIQRLVESLIAEQIPRKFGFGIDEILVLTPRNKGELGVEALNQRIQEAVNPSGAIDKEQEANIGERVLRVNDRVVQRENNYQLGENGVFNGETGIIESINPLNKESRIRFWDGRSVTYERGQLSQLSHAYAMTVHRAQGSESACVVLVIHESQGRLLERQVLYTGITRAKKLLIVLGTRRALARAVRSERGIARYSALCEQVKRNLS